MTGPEPARPWRLERSVRRLPGRDGTVVLVGGDPGRILRLSPAGAAALASGPPAARRGHPRLVEHLVAAGMAAEGPAGEVPGPDALEVVVPVRDDAAGLARCLAALSEGVGSAIPVTVVDDGSVDPEALSACCASAGARLLRRERSGGPAAARNDGLALASRPIVAVVDADAVVGAAELCRLAAWLADPAVAAVAPRIRPLADLEGGGSGPVRFGAAHSPLDLGPDPGLVERGARVAYVPSTVLVLRAAALGAGFDPAFRFGEDVELVWRLTREGRRVVYDADVIAHHREPGTWRGLLVRRHHYGRSAAPLALAHGEPVGPVLDAWSLGLLAAAWAGGVAGVAAAIAGRALHLRARARRAGWGDLPASEPWRWSGSWALGTWSGLGRWTAMTWWPLLLAGLARPGRTRRLAAGLLLVPPLAEWVRRRPSMGPVGWISASLADDAAYGSGVWAGCIRHRCWRPVVPRLRRS